MLVVGRVVGIGCFVGVDRLGGIGCCGMRMGFVHQKDHSTETQGDRFG